MSSLFFSARALEKRLAPPPPPHSAVKKISVQVTMHAFIQYMCHCRRKNTTTTTTTQCKLQYRSHHHLCQYRVSAPVNHRKKNTSASYMYSSHHHMCQQSICASWSWKKTTSASYCRLEPAPPPLECTLQQANVTGLRACH